MSRLIVLLCAFLGLGALHACLVHVATDVIAWTDDDTKPVPDHGGSDERSCAPGCATSHRAPPTLAPESGSPHEQLMLAPADVSVASFEGQRAPPARSVAPPERPPRIRV